MANTYSHEIRVSTKNDSANSEINAIDMIAFDFQEWPGILTVQPNGENSIIISLKRGLKVRSVVAELRKMAKHYGVKVEYTALKIEVVGCNTF